jgi:hypothetical protein
MSALRTIMILMLAAGSLLPLAAHAQATLSQVRSPATCISFDVGNPNWGNPARAVSSNNSFATSAVNDNQSTDALVCTQYGFAIPASATVLGIIVRVERRASSIVAPTRDALVRVLKGGAAEPAERATGTAYTTADVVEDHGTAIDLWGTTWTPADINDNPGFGAAFMAYKNGTAGGNITVSVDHVQIEVFYTNNAPPAPALTAPADGATVATSNPNFTWGAVVDPDGDTVTYDIQADDSGCGFASPEINQTGVAVASFTPGSGLANATYCWRVRAVDQFGLAGPWSATRNVTVNAAVVVNQTGSPGGAGDCTNQAGIGTRPWANTGNAISSNNGYATVSVDGQTSNWLRCLNYGFTIPAGATIVGIELRVERRSSSTGNGGSDDAGVRLVKGGAVQPTDYQTNTDYTTTDAVATYGSPSDLWGNTWTPAEINAANFGAVFAATKPSGAGAAHTVSVDHMEISVYYTMPVVVNPGSFNAFETGTAAGAINGVITTKVAGVVFSLDVVAISGGAQLASFTNAVTVDLLGNTALGVALDAQNCPTAFTVLQTVAPNPTINTGRSTVNFAAVANVWRDVRVRVRYPVGAPTVTSCSADNFAIRPSSFALVASDNDWQTAGAVRTLDNAGAAGGVVHKAGRSFTLQATPAPVTATNYAGDPTVSTLACSLPAGCANGTLALGAFAGAGTRTSNTATYSEAGAFNLTLADQTFASVDSADGTPANCTATGRYVCQSAAPLAVGRFVPDRFALGATTAPVFRTFDALDAACSVPPAGPRRSFTYVGQYFGYATVPAATITAQNASGGTTTNYRGALWKLNAASASQSVANAPVLAIDTALIGAPTLTEIANTGTGTLSANAGDKIAFVRDNATPLAPFTANLDLTWSVSDASEAGPNQGTITTTSAVVFSGVAFDSGSDFRYGRLRLGNANGSQLVPLPVLMETQYWLGVSGFVTNAADHCTSIAGTNVAMSTFTGNLAACETAVSGGGTLTSGRRTLLLAAPGNANDGSVILTANLGAAPSGTTCTVVGGAVSPAAGADRAYLQGNWTGALYDDNPGARATFGTFKGAGEVIFMRENF